MAKAASNSASVPYLNMRDVSCGVLDQWVRFPNQRAEFERTVPCHRTHNERTVFRTPDFGNLANAVQIDQKGRTRQAQIQDGYQALPAGNDFCAGAIRIQEGDRLL